MVQFQNVEQGPLRRSNHAMASVGTRVLVLGGYSTSTLDEIPLIHIFDTGMYFLLVISSR